MKKLVICATQRSGSTMICEDITQTGVMGRPQEHMIGWIPDGVTDWKQKFEEVLRKGSSENGVFSVKVMANQLKNIESCINWTKPLSDRSGFPRLSTLMEGAVWLWVKRRDTLDQAISQYVAQSRGYYHAFKESKKNFQAGKSVSAEILSQDLKNIPYDFQEIMKAKHFIDRGNMIWQGFFRENEIDPILVDYDSASTEAGRIRYLLNISEHLGENFPDIPERNLVKLSNQQNQNLKRRFLIDLMDRG